MLLFYVLCQAELIMGTKQTNLKAAASTTHLFPEDNAKKLRYYITPITKIIQACFIISPSQDFFYGTH